VISVCIKVDLSMIGHVVGDSNQIFVPSTHTRAAQRLAFVHIAAEYCKSQDSFEDEVAAKVCGDEVIGEL
jgi:hypothetical protein